MNLRQKIALACSALGFILSVPCLVRTTPITMMAFFSGSVPLFILGATIYLADLVAGRVLRKGPQS